MSPVTALQVVPALCVVRPDVASAEQVLRLLARRAVAEGYAAETFEAALLEREAAYPTGLPTPAPAAVPHADPQHVVHPGLALALLDPPVPFGEMGSDGRDVACGLVVLLLVTAPEDQVSVLGQVVQVLQRPDWPDALAAATDGADLARRFTDLFPSPSRAR